jgi:hypothetical protein
MIEVTIGLEKSAKLISREIMLPQCALKAGRFGIS